MIELYCGDCVSVMGKLDSGSVDLVVTSPPYDNMRNYGMGLDKVWGEHIWKPIIEKLYYVVCDGGV